MFLALALLAAGAAVLGAADAGLPWKANPAAAAPEHRGTEEALLASGLEWTMLRNGIYADLTAQGLTQSIAAGRHVYNSGDGKTSYVSRAASAVRRVELPET